MTWPELVAIELADREGKPVMLPRAEEDPRTCVCGGWACVTVSRGLPRWCLSCWYRERTKTLKRED